MQDNNHVEREKGNQYNKIETQRRVSNILNLERAMYSGVGEYDMPELIPTFELEPITDWIGFNYVLSDKNPQGKAVHFFIDDYQFERIWENPDRYIEKLKQYVCVVAPDFSLYGDMPLITQMYNHYRKQWVARYFQDNGVTVIPCVRASTDERSFDFYLDGMPKESIVMISNMWTWKEEQKQYFLREFNTMKDKLKPSKIFVYGKHMDELGEDVEYIRTFTEKRWGNKRKNNEKNIKDMKQVV